MEISFHEIIGNEQILNAFKMMENKNKDNNVFVWYLQNNEFEQLQKLKLQKITNKNIYVFNGTVVCHIQENTFDHKKLSLMTKQHQKIINEIDFKNKNVVMDFFVF